jgi:hypothetical protein
MSLAEIIGKFMVVRFHELKEQAVGKAKVSEADKNML